MHLALSGLLKPTEKHRTDLMLKLAPETDTRDEKSFDILDRSMLTLGISQKNGPKSEALKTALQDPHEVDQKRWRLS